MGIINMGRSWLSWPQPSLRSSCRRRSPQASRAAVVTAYLENTRLKVWKFFNREDPSASAAGSPPNLELTTTGDSEEQSLVVAKVAQLG